MRVYQHQRATNDPNGNPQRAYVVYEINGPEGYADIAQVIDEGYEGRPANLRGIPELPSVNISRSDYHALIRIGRTLDR